MMTKTPPAISPQTLGAVARALYDTRRKIMLLYPLPDAEWPAVYAKLRPELDAGARAAIDAHNLAEMMPVVRSGETEE